MRHEVLKKAGTGGRDRAVTARLIGQLALLAKGEGRLVAHHERPWASITFAGTSHELLWTFEGAAVDAGEHLIERVCEHEFVLPGRLVADVAIDEVDHRLNPRSLQIRMTLLLIDEG